MSETNIIGHGRNERLRDSNSSAHIRSLLSNPEGEFLNRIHALPSPFQDRKTPRLSIARHSPHVSDAENSVDKNLKLLLQKVDNLVTTMEKMNKGPIGVDSYRYEVIDHELQEVKKSANKKGLSDELLTTFQSKWFNQKLKEIELELEDIYKSWLGYYSSTIQEIFQLCLSLCTQVSRIKKKKKKQTEFLQNIFEFSTYAAAQKSSIEELLHNTTTVHEFIEVNTFEEISQRITDLEKKLNTPLPVSFDNVPKPMVEDEKNKTKNLWKKIKEKTNFRQTKETKKEKTNLWKKFKKEKPNNQKKEETKEEETEKLEKVKKSENLQVTFQEPEGSKQKEKRKNKKAKSDKKK